MLTWVAKKLFGTSNERAVRRMKPLVVAINELESKMQKLSDAELQAKTAEFKEKLDNGATLDDLLIEAFAALREASKRVLKMRHYDVQLMGGMVLHKGSIAEMRTGEGKTLVATLPIYLNALEGKGVHLITVNDYLAKRDAEWMGRVYKWMGLSIGTIINQQSDEEKRASYKSDICYGQNNEFGFDYLRDNMKGSALEYAQRQLNFAIVDEVDSILIDEARTPLIISGPAEAASEKYKTLNEVVSRLKKDEHFNVDEKGFSATLTDEGVESVQKMIAVKNLYDPVNVQQLHILNQLLRAHALYKKDQHYMVSPDGKILIIDEFTGRVLSGRRWSDGLHQAVEAKENVRIQEESRTMATITFQNLFRIYKKLGGMTGTAQTEAQEFNSTYKLDVIEIPTNKDAVRTDDHDVVYKSEREKFNALTRDIMAHHDQGQPILVGTTSVEKSAAISRILAKKKVKHAVLNAKHHENEAFIVAQAGRKGAITVSTNMAGRGTDIMLGGNPEMIARNDFKEQQRDELAEPEAFAELVTRYEGECKIEHDEVVDLGGLHIIGTERHESRRIDNQLRGRAGRQGDPGYSKFYLSLEDDLMRIFAGDRVKNLMDRMGMPDDEPIEHPLVTRSIENAQRKVEERNFDIRKNLLEYDDVMNAQRKTVYALRQQLLLGRYQPEDVDETGKPTGENREIALDQSIADKVIPIVGQLVGGYCDPPLAPQKRDGKSIPLTRADFEKAGKIVELPSLQHDVYQEWGVKLELEGRKDLTPSQVYEELVEAVPRGLSEQRERVLDLIDRVLSAMVEESCPQNKPAEDWDWKGIAAAFQEHFQKDLPQEAHGLGDPGILVRELYTRAEEIFRAREEEVGVELFLRIFRFVYTEQIDEAWVDHLSNMEHLRDGIGLRGYGQRDPKNEYKKEGYNLFLNMMAKVSSTVLVKLFEVQIQRQDRIAALEAEAEARHHAELEQAIARHPGEETDDQVAALAQMQRIAAGQGPTPQPVKAAPRIGRNDACPCGSGMKFKKCHGALLEEEGASDDEPEEEQPGVIEVEGLTKDFGTALAVRDVTFSVGRGEVVGFLGPNGAGKSTTLRILAGFLGATSGKVRIAGHDIAQDSLAARAALGYMPEAAPLYPELRVREYLEFRARLKRVARAKRHAYVERAMQRAHLSDVAGTTIGHLSKGYRQRVGLADALVADPPLLILDEPTAGLDPNQVREVRGLIKELAADHTVLLSTHILSEVEATCQRALVIDKGRLVAQGTLQELAQGRRSTDLQLVVRDAEHRFIALLEKQAGVLCVETLAPGALPTPEYARLRVTIAQSESPLHVSERLVRALVLAGVDVASAVQEQATLEQVFAELTREDPP